MWLRRVILLGCLTIDPELPFAGGMMLLDHCREETMVQQAKRYHLCAQGRLESQDNSQVSHSAWGTSASRNPQQVMCLQLVAASAGAKHVALPAPSDLHLASPINGVTAGPAPGEPSEMCGYVTARCCAALGI